MRDLQRDERLHYVSGRALACYLHKRLNSPASKFKGTFHVTGPLGEYLQKMAFGMSLCLLASCIPDRLLAAVPSCQLLVA